MKKSNSTSSKRAYIIVGTTSPLASALDERLINQKKTFFGRTNPAAIDNWQKTPSIKTLNDADDYADAVWQQIKAYLSLGFMRISVFIIAGVSSDDWLESISVNEYLPARITERVINGTGQLSNIEDLSLTYIGTAASYLGGKLPYSVTKASLTGLVHSSNRRSPSYVRTNLVIPGAFDGGMIADWDEEKRANVSANTTINQIAKPSQIADALVFTGENEYLADSIINMSAGQITIE